MNDEDLTKAQVAGMFGGLLCIVGFVLLVLAGIGAAIGSAAGWDGWFKTVDIIVAVSTIPIVGIGLFLLGHPPGEGPKFMRDQP